MNVKPKYNCKFKFKFLFSVGVFLLGIGVSYHVLFWTFDHIQLFELETKWVGFKPKEKGVYNYTVVTGLFDIGRGKWWTQGRTYNKYLGFLLQILKMDVNLVVFIEQKGVDFVVRSRAERESRTHIIPTSIEELEYYPLMPRIQEIMDSQQFQINNTNYEKGLPEATDPLYNLVTNSKVSLVHKAIKDNIFDSNYFIWLDGGYGHGDPSIYPPDGIWNPRHLFQYPNQVSYIAFEDMSPSRLKEAKTLHKQKTAWMAGGLFAGGKAAMEKFYSLNKEVMSEYMKEGKIDDDQTTFVDCYLKDPSNFHPVKGDWYDLMKPFR